MSNNVMTIRKEIVAGIKAVTSAAELRQYLQAAVKLEHSTIPPYLAAYYSIKPGWNVEAGKIIRSVVVEEMLHMTIAANVLNAIGGKPEMNHPEFIPTYPGPLPMSVDDGIRVGLAPLSIALVKDVFMRIELPETPKYYPGLLKSLVERDYATIGEFYDAIIAKIEFLGESSFTGNPEDQVVDNVWFPPDQLFPITNVASAVRGLSIIKRQGEGSPCGPMDGDGEPAHYYRFEEIFRGHRLVKDDSVPEGYSFTGAPVPFHQDGVIDMVTDGDVEQYPPGSLALSGVQQANYSYTSMLNALHHTFNGHPDGLKTALGLMYELRLTVLTKVVNQEVTSGDYKGKYAAPSFQFSPNASQVVPVPTGGKATAHPAEGATTPVPALG
ncbi:MAG: ferritin-like protein [Aliidongia sp.]